MSIKDRKLEAKISLSKGWYRARSREEMRIGFRRMASLIKMRTPERIREIERERFGGEI